MSGELSVGDLKLYQEVESLANYIHKAKAEIAALRPDDIQTRYIASATDELDAIVGATEQATNDILDAAEQLEDLSSSLSGEQGQRLTDVTTKIYEACNFQDITGQRITKVVKALQHIEERVDALISAFGPEVREHVPKPVSDDPSSTISDKDLLNGPQLPEKAADQAAIDALFNG
jgi:chemotaxis protein CheZ